MPNELEFPVCSQDTCFLSKHPQGIWAYTKVQETLAQMILSTPMTLSLI